MKYDRSVAFICSQAGFLFAPAKRATGLFLVAGWFFFLQYACFYCVFVEKIYQTSWICVKMIIKNGYFLYKISLK